MKKHMKYVVVPICSLIFSLSLTPVCLPGDESSECRDILTDMLKDGRESVEQHYSEDFHRPRVPSQPNTTVLFPDELKEIYIGMEANDLIKLRPNISHASALGELLSSVFDFILVSYEENVIKQEQEEIEFIQYYITKSRLVGTWINIASNEQHPERKKLVTEKYVKRYCQVFGDPKSAIVTAPMVNTYGAILEWQNKGNFVSVGSYSRENSDLDLILANRIAIGSLSAYSAIMRTYLHRVKNMSPSEQLSTVKQIYPYLESLLTDQTLDGLLTVENPDPQKINQ